MGSSSLLYPFLLLFLLGHLTCSVNSDSDSSVVSESEKKVNQIRLPANSKGADPAIENDNKPQVVTKTQNNTKNATVGCEDGSSENCTENQSLYRKMMNGIAKNKAMLLRTMYVLIALTSIVVVYFIIRWTRLRYRRNKSRKYGLITAPNDLEMAPLDQDDDDEDDMTVFELNGGHKR